jgi:hypothetical protein
MDEIGEALRRAVADPPPSGIEVDALIDRGHRAARRRRWTTAAGVCAAAAVVLLGIASVPALSGPGGVPVGAPGSGSATPSDPGGTPSDWPSGKPYQSPQPPPTWLPTEPAARAVPRLDTAFSRAMSALYAGQPAGRVPVFSPALDGSSWSDGLGGPGVVFFVGGPEAGYKALLRLTDAQGYSTVTVILAPNPPGSKIGCARTDSACQYTVQPDGTAVVRDIVPLTVASADLTGGHMSIVEVLRPDGTHVTIIETSDEIRTDPGTAPGSKGPSHLVRTRPAPTLTLDQLARLAVTAGLTLRP